MKKVFYNGAIYTGSESGENCFADYIMVEDNIIVEIGRGYAVTDEKDVEETDLEGRIMLPGFIDSHAHLFTAAFQLSQIVISFEDALPAVMETIRAYIAEHPGKESYFGIGYNEDIFNNAGPEKEILDEICADKPILIVAESGHEAWVNSKALEIAGVNAEHPDPMPAVQYYKRDCEGNPTGGLIEGATMQEVVDAVKPFKFKEAEETLAKICSDFSSYGITTIADCGFAPYIKEAAERLLDLAQEKKILKQRIFGSNHINSLSEIRGWESYLAHMHKKYCDDSIAFNTFKIVNDGIVENCSASMLEAYEGGRESTAPLLYGSALKNICLKAAKLGYDIHLHGIGDRTIRENLLAAKAIRDAGYHDTRITNAHTQCVAEEDISLFAEYNVIANTSAVWHYGNDDAMPDLGERAARMFPLYSIIKAGAKMTGSSDFPNDELGPQPLKAIETGVTRQLFGRKDSMILKPHGERLPVEEMIKSYTCNAAYQLHMDEKIGVIECGKYADLVVLDKNIFRCDLYEIHSIPVYMTIMDGNITYKK